MNLFQRKDLLVRLGIYLQSNEEELQLAKRKAFGENNWFIPEFIDLSLTNIAQNYLQPGQLDQLITTYKIPEQNTSPKKVGIVMAGNIPLVGFHDLLCVFLTGNHAMVKPSSKDEVLVKHIALKMSEWEPETASLITISEMIRNCDAYIATGSNNSSRYFEYYFSKYPNIIRRNRTSVAILSGNESREELEKLAADVYQFFGLGCRNVTKIFVPKNYDFVPLLSAFRKYDYLANYHKYKNNYDYNLAMHILNNKFYMSNESIILVEEESVFSRIGQLNYGFYSDREGLKNKLAADDNIQCIIGEEETGFGTAQCPGISDYADGVDTMSFLMKRL
jgi:hypothetical protein